MCLQNNKIILSLVYPPVSSLIVTEAPREAPHVNIFKAFFCVSTTRKLKYKV